MLCGGDQHRSVFKEFDVDILRCGNCGHVFSSFRADANYDQYWGDDVVEGDQFYWNEAHAKMYEDFNETLLTGRSGRLLDVGCGLGYFLKTLEHQDNWQGYGCEISPAAVRYANETLGLPNVMCGRLETADLPKNSFDVITLWDLIEHLLEPDAFLQRCHGLLKPGGVCFMHTPNIHMQLPKAHLKKLLKGMRPGVGYLQARDHLHHYSMRSLGKLLERNGFSQIQFIHLHPIQSVSGSKSIVLRGIKNIWFEASRALSAVTLGRLNFDNLFVIARKEPKSL